MAIVLAVAIVFASPAANAYAGDTPQGAAGPGAEQPRGNEPARPSNSVQIGGWIRASVEATVRAGDSDDRARGQAAVAHDRVIARNVLNLRTRYARGRSFEALGTALLTYDLFKPDSAGTPQRASPRTDVHGEVREASVGFFATTFDVRAGMQRIAWGHSDTFAPNDVVNANDLRDPILAETELLHRPTFSVRVDVERPFGTLQIVARPILQPDRYDVYGSNWAFVQPDAPAGYRGALGVLARQPDTSPQDAGTALLVDAARPAGLAGFQGGARFDWHAGTADVTHYYDYGYHGTPVFRIDRAAVALLDSLDWESVSRDQVVTVLAGIGAGDAVGSRWARRHHLGLDLGTTKGPFALRLDAAYQQPALFYDRTLNGWLSPAVQAVFGAEFQTGDLGRTVLVEGRYRHIHRHLPAGGLLFAARDSFDTAVLVRWTWMNRIEFEGRGIAGPSPASYVFRPQIAWKRDGLAVRLGVLLLGGEEGSFGDWYERNRAVYLMVRRAF